MQFQIDMGGGRDLGASIEIVVDPSGPSMVVVHVQDEAHLPSVVKALERVIEEGRRRGLMPARV
jgi:hypothetical protein